MHFPPRNGEQTEVSHPFPSNGESTGTKVHHALLTLTFQSRQHIQCWPASTQSYSSTHCVSSRGQQRATEKLGCSGAKLMEDVAGAEKRKRCKLIRNRLSSSGSQSISSTLTHINKFYVDYILPH